MKKLFISLVVLCTFISVNAQDDCLAFFPNTPGAVLINKTYNANGKLLATTTYTIEQASENPSGYNTQIRISMTDSLNHTIDKGFIEVNCDNGAFYMKSVYSLLSPEILKALSMDTELLGDFMDYSDTFNDNYPFIDGLNRDGGELLLEPENDAEGLVKIRIFNRQHVNNEKITTPANTFNTSKITFDFEVTKGKKTTKYKGAEWYAKNAGIVRSETWDENNNLVNYTELTTLKN